MSNLYYEFISINKYTLYFPKQYFIKYNSKNSKLFYVSNRVKIILYKILSNTQ